MDQQNTQQSQVPQGLLTPEQKNSLLDEIGLENLPEQRKEALVQTLINTALNRIFARILPSLTDQDIDMISELQARPDGEDAVAQYIAGRVPNLEAIAKEEIQNFREEVKDTVATIKASLPQQ